MKWMDRELQRQRVSRALAHVPEGARLLDVGCADGRIFVMAESRLGAGLGLDIDDTLPWLPVGVSRVIGRFPEAVATAGPFDVITMLAVVEHLSDDVLREWGAAVVDLLKPGGVLIITMPSPLVDRILDVAITLRVLDGMDAEAHHGASTEDVAAILTTVGFSLTKHERFQLGLNNLFLFERS